MTIACVGVLTGAIGQQAAEASGRPVWTVAQLPNSYNVGLQSMPAGDGVLVSSLNLPSGYQGGLAVFDPSGTQRWSASTDYSSGVPGGSVATRDGTVVYEENCTPVDCPGSGMRLNAIRNGVLLWRQLLPAETFFQSLWRGGDGRVYVVESHLESDGARTVSLVGYDAVSGAPTRRVVFDDKDQNVNRWLGLVLPYADGVAIPGPSLYTIQYVRTDGSQVSVDATPQPGRPSNLPGWPPAINAGGAVFSIQACIQGATSDPVDCGTNYFAVSRATPAGLSWTRTLPVERYYGSGNPVARALPDGGVAVGVADNGQRGWTVFNADGSTRWSKQIDVNPAAPAGATNDIYSYSDVDNAGRLVLLDTVWATDERSAFPDQLYRSVAVAVLDPNSGGLIDGSFVHARDRPADLFVEGLALGSGRIYANVGGSDSSAGIWGFSSVVGRRYDPTNGSAPPPASRYVAFGDSVAYGHGLANPGKKPEGGLPGNMPPATAAYPSQVATDLGLSFSLRTTGCTLGGDNLAVSGAPSVATQSSGKDTDCRYKGRVPAHKAVFPDEIAAAKLAQDPPSLITIQVGADDVHFSGCLFGLLSVPRNPKTDSHVCVKRQKIGQLVVIPRVNKELDSLEAGLRATINLVHQQAPQARIVVLDYYQIIPDSTATLTGTSPLCRALELHQSLGHLADKRAQADLLQSKINGKIRSVTASYSNAHVTTVELANLFAGHEACVADPAHPGTSQSWMFDQSWDAAHPTALGQQKIAAAIEAKL